MKIAVYCQHILGIGHLKRSLQLCSALADRNHTVLLFLGGPETEVSDPRISVCPLPCLRMDENFGGLFPCNPQRELEEVKVERQQVLLQKVEAFAPDVFITELYPMGRKAFRFELDPVLQRLQGRCTCIASVRDILVEKTEGRDKFEKRAITTLNSLYQGLLIHSDPEVIQLDESFGKMIEITIPIHYTGFIAPDKVNNASPKVISPQQRALIIASIGGSRVGEHLLEQVIKAGHILGDRFRFKIFCGKDTPQETVEKLRLHAGQNTDIHAFSNDFDDELACASLSLSMAGYNTCMNLLQTGVPALCLPFAQNREQSLRIKRLEGSSNIHMLSVEDLEPAKLADRITNTVNLHRTENTIDLNGAHNSAQLIEDILGTNNG